MSGSVVKSHSVNPPFSKSYGSGMSTLGLNTVQAKYVSKAVSIYLHILILIIL